MTTVELGYTIEELQQKPRAVCCGPCGRHVAKHFDFNYIEADLTLRPLPLCERCFRICIVGHRPKYPDAIDDLVIAMTKQQSKRANQKVGFEWGESAWTVVDDLPWE